MTKATSGLADNLSTAILNQNDPETVRDGAPAYLLMLDSLVADAPDNPAMLAAAAQLYAAYGVLFVDDEERANRLTTRARIYAEQALCATNENGCGISRLRYDAFQSALADLTPGNVEELYTYALAWFAHIRASGGSMAALAKLPHAQAALLRVQELDPDFRRPDVQHYLGVLKTIRPPALGGEFDEGRAHFERALELTAGKDLSIKVDFARYYARTLRARELHDRLLSEVLAADPVSDGLTLFNVIAQREARKLLDSADDYF